MRLLLLFLKPFVFCRSLVPWLKSKIELSAEYNVLIENIVLTSKDKKGIKYKDPPWILPISMECSYQYEFLITLALTLC